MSYVVNKTNGNIVAVVDDGTINTTSTSLSIVGRGVNSYGEIMAENLVRLTEHFSNTVEPPYAIAGQLWWDSANGVMKVFNGAVWTSPVPTTYYATDADTAGTGAIDVQNDLGITVGDAAKARLGVTGSLVQLRVGTASPTLVALSADPATGRVQTPHAPVGATDLVNRAYADSISQISSGVSSAVITGTDFVLTVDGTVRMTVDPTATEITGDFLAQTAPASTDSQIVATTEFVQLQKISPALTGVPTAPTALLNDNSDTIATTAFVQGQKISPALTGVPTAPTAAPATNTDQIATTQFVTTAVGLVGGGLFAPINSAALTGVPTAPTALPNTVTDQIATTAYVQQTFGDFLNAPYAPKESPQLTGTPTTPTATANTNSTQIASTAFVQSALSQRLDSYLPKVNPVMQGIPTAPTANVSVSNGQVATTQHVTEKATVLIAEALANYQNFVITYGTQSAVGFTNIIGQWSNATNFVDVFPPVGKSMSNLAGFIPSIAYIYWLGVVNGDDSTRCVWTALPDRIRIYVQNTEQRATPAANWLAIWR